MDARNLFHYWIVGLRGIRNGIRFLIREGLKPGENEINHLEEWIESLKEVLEEMKRAENR